MKEQLTTAILPELPIVGTLKLSSRDNQSLCSIEVVKNQKPQMPHAFFEKCYAELLSYLSGRKKTIDVNIDLSAVSPFQLRVLEQMIKIPYGSVATYKDLASRMKSKGFQAIGTACGKNPLMLIYPCHRIVGSKDLGGFAHGLEMKKELLALEGAL